MQISAEKAERVLKASILKARELGISVCIAILDSGGHLKAFHRVDGAWLGVIDVAIKRAKTSALFEMETQTLHQLQQSRGRCPSSNSSIALSNRQQLANDGDRAFVTVRGMRMGASAASI